MAICVDHGRLSSVFLGLVFRSANHIFRNRPMHRLHSMYDITHDMAVPSLPFALTH